MKISFDRGTFIFGELGCILEMSFGFNCQVVNGLTEEKTEKTAENQRDYSVSSAYSLCPQRLKAGFQYFALKWGVLEN